MAEIDDARLAELIDAARSLSNEIDSLSNEKDDRLTDLSKRSRTNRRMIWMVIAGFSLDIVLTVAMALGLFAVTNNADRINELTQRLDISQTETRQRALCPLYQVFLDSKSEAGRDAAPDPKKYDKAFEVIQDGYDVLKCDQFISDGDGKGPGSDG